jgi:hypothetical protein
MEEYMSAKLGSITNNPSINQFSKHNNSDYQEVSLQSRLSALKNDIESAKNRIMDFPVIENSGFAQTKEILLHLIADFECLVCVLYDEKVMTLIKSSGALDQDFYIRHKMISKLTAEWAKLNHLIADLVFKNISTPEKEFAWLNALVLSAARDLKVDDEILVLPDYDNNFALTRLNYSKDVVILEFPITAMSTPWEWSIVWHEIAGYKVQKMKSKENLIFQKLLEESRIPIIQMLDDAKLLSNLLSGPGIIESFPKYVRNSLTHFAKNVNNSSAREGWYLGYAEELFEDACSTVAFGAPFVEIFMLALNRRKYQSDFRHPTYDIREESAKKLANIATSSYLVNDLFLQNLRKLLIRELPVAQNINHDQLSTNVRETIVYAMKAYLANPQQSVEIANNAKDQLSKLGERAGVKITFGLEYDDDKRKEVIQSKIDEFVGSDARDQVDIVNKLCEFPLSFTDWADQGEHDHITSGHPVLQYHGQNHGLFHTIW